MLSDESLDRFLDDFLSDWPATEAITIHKEKRRKADIIEEEITIAPPKSHKLPKRTVASLFLILFLIPLTIWFGMRIGDRKYMFISLMIVAYTMIPFFMVFEGRKPQARELVVLAVLSAIAVAGRAAFFMLPQFKPLVAIVIIAGISFGAESGFLVGAISMFASNMFFSQGPWTPWQMFAAGIIGFLAGILFRKGRLGTGKFQLCLYGFLSTFFIYGLIMNTASAFMYQSQVTWASLLPMYFSGAPMDLIHATATAFFLFVFSRPMLEKLERIKIKYGLIERDV